MRRQTSDQFFEAVIAAQQDTIADLHSTLAIKQEKLDATSVELSAVSMAATTELQQNNSNEEIEASKFLQNIREAYHSMAKQTVNKSHVTSFGLFQKAQTATGSAAAEESATVAPAA